MKKAFFIILCLLLVSLPVFAQGSPSVRTQCTSLTPYGDESWDKGTEADVQLLFTGDSPRSGLLLSAGMSTWNARETTATAYYSSTDTTATARLGGEATLIPVGASLLYRIEPVKMMELNIETGMRYVFVDSRVKMTSTAQNSQETLTMADTVEIGDSIIGLLAADVAVTIFKGLRIYGGGGYQMDIHKGEVRWLGVRAADNELKARFLRMGLVMEF